MLAIVGGGIVGLATAYALRHLKPVVFEKEKTLAAHQTGHNSGVIHSGIYYRPGSEKARLCVEGARRMAEFCREHGIGHARCGKVIVATEQEELPRLDELERRGKANGVQLERIGPERLREIEPHCRGLSAVHIPTAGIADYPAVARKLAEFVEVRTGVHVNDVRDLKADLVINCAGLFSDRLARSRLRIVPFRGEYYHVRRESLVKGLIYPVPDPSFPFLGVHFTQQVGGGLEAGPNAVLAFKREGYRWRDVSLRDTLDTLSYPGFRKLALKYWRMGSLEIWRSIYRPAFLKSCRRLLPEIRDEDLVRAGAGVRAQALDEDGSLLDDFRIERGPGVIHVLNAPSPAATASLAIGDHIASFVKS